MDASGDNVIPFPGRDAGGMAWQVRGIGNGVRAAAHALSAAAEPAAAVPDSGAALARLAVDAAEVSALLTRLADQLATLRRCSLDLDRP